MSFIAVNLLIAICALLFERIFGFPDFLYRIIRHPVVWMGALISTLDKRLNRPEFTADNRRLFGAVTLLILLFLTALISGILSSYFRALPAGVFLEALLASMLLSQKSLKDHVRHVHFALGESLSAGREAVGHIVGRDPASLDESEVSKAAIESLAENTADGVIAPLFWLVLFGLPGAAVYKAINTADSMLGYRSETHRDFGWVSARLDDVVNYPAARLCGLLFVSTAFISRRWDGAEAFSSMMRDARSHVSPNAGWPEAAMAGALDLSLGGSRSYDGRTVDLPTMGKGRTHIDRKEIGNALSLYGQTLSLTLLLLCILFVLTLGVLV